MTDWSFTDIFMLSLTVLWAGAFVGKVSTFWQHKIFEWRRPAYFLSIPLTFAMFLQSAHTFWLGKFEARILPAELSIVLFYVSMFALGIYFCVSVYVDRLEKTTSKEVTPAGTALHPLAIEGVEKDDA